MIIHKQISVIKVINLICRNPRICLFFNFIRVECSIKISCRKRIIFCLLLHTTDQWVRHKAPHFMPFNHLSSVEHSIDFGLAFASIR